MGKFKLIKTVFRSFANTILVALTVFPTDVSGNLKNSNEHIQWIQKEVGHKQPRKLTSKVCLLQTESIVVSYLPKRWAYSLECGCSPANIGPYIQNQSFGYSYKEFVMLACLTFSYKLAQIRTSKKRGTLGPYISLLQYAASEVDSSNTYKVKGKYRFISFIWKGLLQASFTQVFSCMHWIPATRFGRFLRLE